MVNVDAIHRGSKMVNVDAIRKAQRAEGLATVMAIGTETPLNCVDQSTYPDYYFRITNSEHKTELKEKFKRMCEKSTIKKRYMHLTEEILKENPNICAYMEPSLNARQDMISVEVPKLGKEAANKAIKEWGQPKSKITHLVFCTTSGVHLPGADYQLSTLLGLSPSVKRLMMYNQGCYGGATALRLAKDFAENNKGARVLVVCSEIFTVATFRGPGDELSPSAALVPCCVDLGPPSSTPSSLPKLPSPPSDPQLNILVGQALFADGAGAVIVGADPVPGIEKPLFEMISAAQTTLPDSEVFLELHLGEAGMTFHPQRDVPGLISNHIEKSLAEAFEPLGISDCNSIFWVSHPGGPTILDQVEAKLALKSEKLRATRDIFSEYGNMASACVLFVLDEMRKKSAEEGLKTTGEGLEWGVLFGFGPGVTVETMVLHSMAT